MHGGPNVTVVAALTPNGLQAAMTGSEAVNGDVFAHKVAGLTKIVAAREAFLLYLPLHSPDFNPIKLALSKLKTWLHMIQASTREASEAPIQTATE